MKYLVIKKDATRTEVEAEGWRWAPEEPPVFEFYNGPTLRRRRDVIVLTVIASEVTTIEDIQEEGSTPAL